MSTQKKNTAFTVLMVFLCLALGVAAAAYLMYTKPTTKRVRPPVSSPLVTTVITKRDTAPLDVEALGTVLADQETVVRVRVSGQVEELGPNFNVGGLVQKGNLLLRLDDDDYVNALASMESMLAKAEADYSLEMGQQRVARTEIAQLNRTAYGSVKTTPLALRQPQLAQAKATLQAAEVDVKQAKLNLERTKVLVPYNALVTARNVSMGSQASPSDSVATLVGTDTYHIEAAIPLDKLQGLGMDTFNNTKVKITTTTGAVREGYVRHSIASLDATTRMGRVLIEIKDPLALESDEAPLLLGDQVRVELQAGTLPNVIELPRITLRGGDNIWVVKKGTDNKEILDIRKVEVLWKDTDSVLVGKGLEAGEAVITSPLGAPINGMPVRTRVEKMQKPQGKGENSDKPAKTDNISENPNVKNAEKAPEQNAVKDDNKAATLNNDDSTGGSNNER